MTNPIAMAAVLTLTLFGQNQTPTTPAQTCPSVKGTFEARTIPPEKCPQGSICTEGELTGGLQGQYRFQGTPKPDPLGAPVPASVHVFVGQSTVTLDKGGTLAGVDSGVIDLPPGQGGFASLITWKDGGQISLRGALVPGATKGEYEGTACGAR
jgi:hypothetical protein